VSQLERIEEIVATYLKHGWQLRRMLVTNATLRKIESTNDMPILHGIKRDEASIDALWFSRNSHAGREAWELRLVSDTPYALFETFEKDESEGEREEARSEMEARLKDYASNG
jgi:hypothetical protein